MTLWFSNQTQVYWACQALLSGRTISHKSEIREVNEWRLSAIVHRLRDKYKWPIVTELRGPENVAYYSLPPGTDGTRLLFPPSAKALAQRPLS